jgi:exosome complex component RRP46
MCILPHPCSNLPVGHTAALASCSGPSEVRPLSELPSSATLDVLVRPLSGLAGPSSKSLASSIRSVLLPTLELERYPRSLVQVVVQALSTGTAAGAARSGGGYGPSLIAACVNAAGCAVLSAGSVNMHGVLCAVAVGRRRSGEAGMVDLVLDPEDGEETVGGGCFAFLIGVPVEAPSTMAQDGIPHARLVWTNYTSSLLNFKGPACSMTRQELDHATELAKKGAMDIWKTLRDNIEMTPGTTVQAGSYTSASDVYRTAKSKNERNPVVMAGRAGEMEDEMEEVGDDHEARMEI